MTTIRHYVFAVLGMWWPDWFVRCYRCDSWEHLTRAHSVFTPDTHFTAERTDWYCRSCKEHAR